MFTFKEFANVYDDFIKEDAVAQADPNVIKSQQLGQQLNILDQKRARLLLQKNQVDQLIANKQAAQTKQQSTQSQQIQQNTAMQAQQAAAAAPAQGTVSGVTPQ